MEDNKKQSIYTAGTFFMVVIGLTTVIATFLMVLSIYFGNITVVCHN